jgi:signal transduction histidine kinase
VEKHKGYISALSNVNEGATFIISLPLEQNEKTSATKIEEPPI